MAEKNVKQALQNANQSTTEYSESTIKTLKQILDYKKAAEANIVAIIYKKPDVLYNINLAVQDFHHNEWRTFFQIAYGVIITESKASLDDITIGFYLEKHPELKKNYEKYGSYETIDKATTYIKEENLDGYIVELKKWKVVIELCKSGFPVDKRLQDYIDMSEEEIYKEHELLINHIFANSSQDIKSYNAFDGMNSFIEELNTGSQLGVRLYNAELLTDEIGGFNLNGHIYGLGAGSGVGKSTMAFNYLVPSAIKSQQKIVFIINEEDERKIKKELLIWVANNVFNFNLQKKTLRDGHFTSEVLQQLHECAKWIEDKKEEQFLTIIPLERYSVNLAVKIIKKYATLGVRIFVLDTLKESFDADTDEIYKSMMRDMITLYDTVKSSAKNVGLFVTYQLGKASLKQRYLTNNDIGQAKSIVDVMSVNLMMRRFYEDEYEGGAKSLPCTFTMGKHGQTQVTRYMKKEQNPMITFITKNRFGETNRRQIISECDLSTNIYKDVAYAQVVQDF